jgi:hypothetical protein
VPPLEASPAPPLGVPAAGVADGGDLDDGGDDNRSSHNTDLSEEQELEGWVARPITCDAARGCHFHDALDTLLCQALDRRTWSIKYRCVVFQHNRGVYPDRWEATCLLRRPENSLWGAKVCSEHTLSLSGTLLRRPCRMPHSVRFHTTAQCSMGWPMVSTRGRYYLHRPSGSTRGMVVSPAGDDNLRLSSMVNLAAVLNTELDHALDELSRARAEIAQLRAERVEHRQLEDWSPAPVGTQHPYRSPHRGHHAYGNPDCRTRINLEPYIISICWSLVLKSYELRTRQHKC